MRIQKQTLDQEKDQDFLDLLPFMSPLVDSIDNNTSWNLDLIQKQGRTQGKYKEFMNLKNVYDLSDV